MSHPKASQESTRPREIVAHDRCSTTDCYRYWLTEPMGDRFHPDFLPQLTPKEMLALGAFGGKYMTDCRAEFPRDWYTHARLSTAGRSSPRL